MHAMELRHYKSPLTYSERAVLPLLTHQLRIAVTACGVCRTDLHLMDGELPPTSLPVVPGHEIVGRIIECGEGVDNFEIGQRVGVPWLATTCGNCTFCRAGQENLCPKARFTGHGIDGGYAQQTIADCRYVFPIPDIYSDVEAAPLLCAGLIGWRTLAATGSAKQLGIFGFGAAAHIITQVATIQGRNIFAFVRPGDAAARKFALQMGAYWSGFSDEVPPIALDAALIFAPVGELIPAALKTVRPGGRVVCGGIHMSDVPSFPYALLWEERSIRSVANLTRHDAHEFFAFAAVNKLKTVTHEYALKNANSALADLRQGRISGAAVIVPEAQTDASHGLGKSYQ